MFDKFLNSRNWKGRKERRKSYRDSKAFDCTCRNHGSCDWCKNNRTFFDKKDRVSAELQLDIPEEDLNILIHEEKLQKAIELERFEEEENYYQEGYWDDLREKFS